MNIVDINCKTCGTLHSVEFSQEKILPDHLVQDCLVDGCSGLVFNKCHDEKIIDISIMDISSDSDLFNEDGDEIEELDVITRQETGY